MPPGLSLLFRQLSWSRRRSRRGSLASLESGEQGGDEGLQNRGPIEASRQPANHMVACLVLGNCHGFLAFVVGGRDWNLSRRGHWIIQGGGPVDLIHAALIRAAHWFEDWNRAWWSRCRSRGRRRWTRD